MFLPNRHGPSINVLPALRDMEGWGDEFEGRYTRRGEGIRQLGAES